MNNSLISYLLPLPVFLLLLCIICGCSQDSLEFTEIKRIDERITSREYRSFLKIIRRLPDRKLSNFPTVFIPPPDWKSNRALPVKGLVKEEQEKHMQRWDEEWLARSLKDNRPLKKALKYQRMTEEQFVGLTLTIGMAMSKSTLRENQDLDEVISQGQGKIRELNKRKEIFSSIIDKEDQFSILNNAVWITRVNRAERLMEVPRENVAFVEKHWEHLVKIFPNEFHTNPLDSIADILEELGVPFVEPDPEASDSRIGVNLWKPGKNDIRGTDPI